MSWGEWESYWAQMPNTVRALYGTFSRIWFPWFKYEIRIEARGQLCAEDPASRAIAYHMWNHGMRRGWRYISWRCDMDGEPYGGGPKSGPAPRDFCFKKYGLPHRNPERQEKRA